MHAQLTAHVDDETVMEHKIIGRDREPFAVVQLGRELDLIVSDTADLERLAAECLAAANALRAAKGDTFEGNGQDEDELDAALLADGAA